jgi:hypothetical protein
VSGDFEDTILACHCTQCQTWTGGAPLFSVRALGPVSVDGAQATESYRASAWGERVFCGTCGTTLWWKMQDRPISSVAPGLFAGQAGLTVNEEIFADRRASWIPPWPGATQSTEADELAKLNAYMEGQET